MKTLLSSTLALLLSAGMLHAQDVTTVQASNSDISENLDLQAVAAVFGEAKDLEDFERKLNDPDLQICNLDLNGDGFVDYLRVIESSQDGIRLVVIQAVLGNDVFQDVATIDVERDNTGSTRVQVVGDVYMYGPNYVIEPYYVQQPVIYVYFWGPRYRPWHSPYYWGYYPTYYRPWNPYPVYTYHQHVHVHIHRHPGNTYGYVGHRHSKVAGQMHRKVQRNDYGAKHPDRTFAKRNAGVTNKQELTEKKAPTRTGADRPSQSAKPVDKDWGPAKGQQPVDRKQSEPINGRLQVIPSKEGTEKPAQRSDTPARTTESNPTRQPAQQAEPRMQERPAQRSETPARTPESNPTRQPAQQAEPRMQERPTQAPPQRTEPRQEREREQPKAAPAPQPERKAPQQKMEQRSAPSKSTPRQGNSGGKRERGS